MHAMYPLQYKLSVWWVFPVSGPQDFDKPIFNIQQTTFDSGCILYFFKIWICLIIIGIIANHQLKWPNESFGIQRSTSNWIGRFNLSCQTTAHVQKIKSWCCVSVWAESKTERGRRGKKGQISSLISDLTTSTSVVCTHSILLTVTLFLLTKFYLLNIQ